MIRKLRLATSLVIYAFVTCHLLTISFALGGLPLLDQAAAMLTDPWLHSPLKLLLMPSMIIHVGLGMYALYQRNTLRMSSTDTVQYLCGFLLPFALLPHIISISISSDLSGSAPKYSEVLTYLWVLTPWSGLLQVIALLTAWIHGSIGILTLLHTKHWWPKMVWLINPAVVAIPVMAMLGFVEGGRIVVLTISETINQADSVMIDSTVFRAQALFSAVLAAVLLARYVRLHRAGKQSIVLQYTDGPRVRSAAGTTILEISHLYNVPHANLCRGRGRCGTCRCRIGVIAGSLSAMNTLERETLRKVSATEGERLACHCKPTAGVYSVERIIAPDIGYGLVTDDQELSSIPTPAPGNSV